jgi:hypothetical protein
VLVVDEVGYRQRAADAANALYGVVDPRCLKLRPIVFTPPRSACARGPPKTPARASIRHPDPSRP